MAAAGAVTEARMRARVVEALRPLHAVAVEAGGAPGLPDVNHARGWIELKQIGAWPARPETIVRVEHFTLEQRLWIAQRARAIIWSPISVYADVPESLVPVGLVHVLLRVGDGALGDWLLLDGNYAAENLGKTATRRQLLDASVKAWERGLDDGDLLRVLRMTER